MTVESSKYESAMDEEGERLASLLSDFCQRWENHGAPDIADLLTGIGRGFRLVALNELIKLDMQFRSREGEAWLPLEDYLARWPELAPEGQPPADLVFEEFRIRKMVGADVDTLHYKKRFPGAFPSLTRLVSQDESRRNQAASRPVPLHKFQAGDRLEDFDLLARLGKGAFGTVFLARQNSMQRLVALKISSDQGMEHQTLAQLDHPNIVRVFDSRVLENPPVRLMYMQYIPGGTLNEVVREATSLAGKSAERNLDGSKFVAGLDKLLAVRGETATAGSENSRRLKSCNWSAVVSGIGREIANALDFAHRHNVLHRDLKPANVLIDRDGHARLVDFNISFCSKLDGAAPGTFFGGSLAYMSPEQLEACSPDHDRSPADLDGRSDIFSLGILLFELVTGDRPFPDQIEPGNWSQTTDALIQARRTGLTPQNEKRLDGVSPFLVRVIRRSVESDPASRFPKANRMLRHLKLAGNEKALSAFRPPGNFLTWLAGKSAVLATGLLSLGISAAAALFIFAYNLQKSVPEEARELFQGRLVPIMNLLLFALGTVLVFRFSGRIRKTIRKQVARSRLEPAEIRKAIVDNLMLGNRGALLSISAWTIAGLGYPVLLTLSGFAPGFQGWTDFVGSHFLAGLIAGAYVFWLLNWCAVHVWQPVLLEASLDHDEESDWSGLYEWLEGRCSFYHILALAIPPVAIIWLVVYHESRDKIALTVVSVVSVLGLLLLAWVSRGVQKQVDLLKSLFESEKEF
jgi:eukaryotic-like serine/threonine-protein kinase